MLSGTCQNSALLYSWEVSHQRHSSTKLPEEGSREPYSLWVVLDTVHCSGHKHCGSQSLELRLMLQELSIRETVFFRSLKSSGIGCKLFYHEVCFQHSTNKASWRTSWTSWKKLKKNIKNKSIELAKRINLELRVIKLGTSHTLGSKAANQSSTKKFVFLRKTERKDKNKVNSPLGAIFGIDI